MFAKFLLFILTLLAILLGIAVLRAALLHNPDPSSYCNTYDEDYVSDDRNLSSRLSHSLMFRTVNYKVHDYEREALSNFTLFLRKSFPLVHSSNIVNYETVNNYSLLYYVQGRNKNLKPYLLAGHMDVVPVDESKWTIDPFGGIQKDDFIWGRGAIDCKHVVMGILEALEFLLEKGYQPQRSFYIAFGHDEESEGSDGAKEIGKLLKSRNVQLEYILDEGFFIVDKFISGIKGAVALIGISEKGHLNLDISVSQIPGHSSMPPSETAIIILSKALSKLKGDMFPSMFGKGPEKLMFDELAHAASFPLKIILANTWLFKPFIIGFMSSPTLSAFHKTTIAVTMIGGGTKVNVLPATVSAKVNLRIHPAQSVEEVVEYIKNTINDDRVQVSVLSHFKPHPVSPIDSFGYLTVKKSIKQIYNDTVVAPSTLIANTDTRWYLDLTNSLYRFSLVRIILDDLKRVHGHDERILISNYIKLVNFFVHLIKNSDETNIEKHVHTDL